MAWPSYDAGTARLTIEPHFGNLFQQIDSRVRAHNPPSVQVGLELAGVTEFRNELRTTIAGMNPPAVPVEMELTGVNEFRNELRTVIAGMNPPEIEVGVRLDANNLRTRLQGELAGLGGDISIPVNVDLTRAYDRINTFRAYAGRPINIDVDIDAAGALGHMALLMTMAHSLSQLLGSLPMPTPSPGPAQGAAVAMKGLGLATSAAGLAMKALAGVSLIPLIGQIVKAAGVISLIPAAGAAAAATFGTIKIGMGGVTDAITAQGEAAADSGEEQVAQAKAVAQAQRGVEDAQKNVARTAEQGARQIRSAEKSVASAQRDSKRAQEDLNEAREDAVERIEDLNLALKGSALDERSAALSVREAYEQMQETLWDPEASATERERAILDHDQAIQRLAEVRERNGDLRKETEEATRAGVEGSTEVVAAKERIAETDEALKEAQENLALAQRDAADANTEALQAVTDAQAALNEAMTTGGGKVDEYAKALAELSPNAREFVEAVGALRDEWDSLKFSVQDALFANLGPQLTELSQLYLPQLTASFTGLAEVLNTKLQDAMNWLKGPDVQQGFTTILDNTTAALGPLLDGLGNIGRALYDLAVVGSDFLPGITQAFDDGTAGFAASIHEMATTLDENGKSQLHNFMQEAIDTFAQLWRIAMNIKDIAVNLFTGSDEVGESWLDSIESATKSWAEKLGTPEGQKELKEFFADVKSTVDGIVNALEKVGELMLWIDGLRGGREDSPVIDENGDVVLNPDGTPKTEDTRTGWRKAWDWTTGQMENGAFGWLFGDDSVEDTLKKNGGVQLFPGGPSLFGGGGGGEDKPVDPRFNEESLRNAIEGGGQGQGITWDSLVDTWDTKLFPALDTAATKAGEVGAAFLSGIGQTAKDAWTGLSTGVVDGWNSNIAPAWTALRTDGLDGLADHFVEKITNGAVTSWEELPSKIGSGVKTLIDEHFPALGRGLDDVESFFAGLRDGIRDIWNDILGNISEAVNSVIDMINGGVGGLWNQVDDFLGGKLGKWTDIGHVSWGTQQGRGGSDKVKIPGMETGGLVPLEPGTTWGKDGVLRVLAPGEYVLSEPAVRAAGIGNLDAFNSAARGGRNTPTEGLFALESGGRVTRDDPAWEALKRGHDFAKAQDGKPYQWAGPTGPGDSFDCSGFMLSIAAEILGYNPWQRYGYTGSFNPATGGPLGFVPGLGAGLSVGVFDNPGGEGGGHMAGTLSGVEGLPDVNVEAGGWPSMVKYGTNNAAGASHSQFPWKFHLPIVDGAFVDPGPGGGGVAAGPTQADQSSLAGKFFDKLLGPLREKLVEYVGEPPPELRKLPPAVFDEMVQPIRDVIVEKTALLDVVADGVKKLTDMVSGSAENAWDFVFNRDTGGNLPPGLNLVLNKTGQDEYVLEPFGFQAVRDLVDALTGKAPLALTDAAPYEAPAGTYNGPLPSTQQGAQQGTRKFSTRPDGTLSEQDMLNNMAPEARRTFEEQGTQSMLDTRPLEMRMADWGKTYSAKWANWGKETASELIDDALSPLGLQGISIGTMVTQDVPEAVTRLQRLADMAARGYTRTMGR